MGECFTPQAQLWWGIEIDNKIGQVIQPLTTFILEYIDLRINMWLSGISWQVCVYNTDEFLHPTGDPISIGSYGYDPWTYVLGTKVRRHKMSSALLIQNTNYAVVIEKSEKPDFSWAWVAYTYGPWSYPRGHLIYWHQDDPIWHDYLDLDLYFCLFGNPPLVKPDPVPPTDKWALVDNVHIPTPEGLFFYTSTSTPCHQYFIWTNNPLRKHKTPLLRRGTLWKDAVRFCFDDWHYVEQLEIGDTMFHTFDLSDWPVCETRWYTYLAFIDQVFSPSTAPVFEYHRKASSYFYEPYTDTGWPPVGPLFYEEYTIGTYPPEMLSCRFIERYTW